MKTNRFLLATLLLSAAAATFIYAVVKRRAEALEEDSPLYARPEGGETDPDGEAELFIGS